jgi:hypothetical protein
MRTTTIDPDPSVVLRNDPEGWRPGAGNPATARAARAAAP